MNLNQELPQSAAQVLSDLTGHDGAPRFAAASDLTLDRRYGQSYLAVMDGHVASCDGDGGAVCLPLADIKEVKVDELFGGGRLVAETSAGDRGLVYYTKACVPEFAAMCRVINDLLNDRPPQAPEEDERAYCAKCNAPLPERGTTCPLCVPRWEVFRRLLAFVRPYRGKGLLLMGATIVAVAAQMGPPYLTKLIVDEVIKKKDLAGLPIYIAAMVACGVMLLGARFVSGTLTSWLASRVVADLRERLHTHLQSLRMRYFNRRESGELVARVAR